MMMMRMMMMRRRSMTRKMILIMNVISMKRDQRTGYQQPGFSVLALFPLSC